VGSQGNSVGKSGSRLALQLLPVDPQAPFRQLIPAGHQQLMIQLATNWGHPPVEHENVNQYKNKQLALWDGINRARAQFGTVSCSNFSNILPEFQKVSIW